MLAITTEQVLVGLLVAVLVGGLWEKFRDREESRDRIAAKKERETQSSLDELRQGLEEVRRRLDDLEGR